MRPGFSFEIAARDGDARRATLTTPHGTIQTPAFMPVATYGAVRGVAPDELRDLGADILLAHTYHLHERPGDDIVAACGGLHGFTGWTGPWITDSGGYQVTSLADRLTIDEEGVEFSSPLDGQRRLLTPERAIAIQENLGSDIAMVLDECQPPESHDTSEATLRARGATDRTLRWGERCAKARKRADQAVFGIVQGGASEALRRESARATAALGFDGYAHGGLGLGEEPARRDALVAAASLELPDTAPRYLMGLGKPRDLVAGIAQGVDLFDCVIPTRHARHGAVFTREGRINLKNARFKADPEPPDPGCDCPTCARFSRAYLRHLILAGESLGARLASLHNLRFYLRLMQEARRAIESSAFARFAADVPET